MIPIAKDNCFMVSSSTNRRDIKPLDLIKYFLYEDPTFSEWYKNAKVLQHRSACVVTLMNPLENPFKDNVLFIGDACWRREISNLGALCTGWKAGKSIAKALNQGKPNEEGIKDYIDWYQEHYYNPFGRRKQSGRNFLDYLDPEDIDYLVEMPEHKLEQTMDIFKVVNIIGKTYGELMSRIYEERPDIMNKLTEVRENMDEDMKKQIKSGFRTV